MSKPCSYKCTLFANYVPLQETKNLAGFVSLAEAYVPMALRQLGKWSQSCQSFPCLEVFSRGMEVFDCLDWQLRLAENLKFNGTGRGGSRGSRGQNQMQPRYLLTSSGSGVTHPELFPGPPKSGSRRHLAVPCLTSHSTATAWAFPLVCSRQS